ncbi:hypothetical protein GIB67_033370 [Kingdonia uniflora]|uniref:K Homology domain-containing protein n=1 Tax=Kingdonia uniflora TaxID=39325 RepID=A0A7J7LTL5_9MAGN|nr:hypothetical protein GIB67_033370 [Kingdonia uniflora]
MERSRQKRSFYDFDAQNEVFRTKPKYHHHYKNTHYDNNGGNPNGHHRRDEGAFRSFKKQLRESSASMVLTHYRILCHDAKAGGVIGKSGSIIKRIRRETGAWINVHHLVSDDEERIIEISDKRIRDPNGRLPEYSPAQEALLMVHERMIEKDNVFKFEFSDDDDYDPRDGGRGGGNVSTRLVVAKPNVGSLLGKGGKIIEKMRLVTKTQIRILPRDRNLPRCVSMSDEVVQVVGDSHAVKQAVEIIASLVRESQFRDRSHFNGRSRSPEEDFLPDDDFSPRLKYMSRQSSMDGPASGPRLRAGLKDIRSDDHEQTHDKEIVFRILCPRNMVDKVMGETDGIMELLQGYLGVEVQITEMEPGSDEQIITISSDEGPDDDLFPAQEALLHIQSQIVDLGPDKENIITTRLLVPSSEIECLEGRDGSLSELTTLTGANIKILSSEELSLVTSGDGLVQIVGEVGAARNALVEVTERLRSHLYREIPFRKDSPKPSISGSKQSQSKLNSMVGSPDEILICDGYPLSDFPVVCRPDVQKATAILPLKDAGASGDKLEARKESDIHEDAVSGLNSRLSVPLVTKSTLEVVIPKHAISKLIMRSGSKLAQISELSGASVNLMGDAPEVIEKVIQISGTPDQTQKAQSLLQGFILSRLA